MEGIPKEGLPALSPYIQVKISQSQEKAFQGEDISGSGHFRQKDQHEQRQGSTRHRMNREKY